MWAEPVLAAAWPLVGFPEEGVWSRAAAGLDFLQQGWPGAPQGEWGLGNRAVPAIPDGPLEELLKVSGAEGR